jgi:hypothetical protein
VHALTKEERRAMARSRAWSPLFISTGIFNESG